MIRFSTESARLSHPQGCLVNSFLMDAYFNNTLTASELELLSNQLGMVDFIDLLSQTTESEQIKLLICLWLRTPQAHESQEELVTRLREVVSDEVIVKSLALTGHFDLIDFLGAAQSSLKKAYSDQSIAESLILNKTSQPFIRFLDAAQGYLKSDDLIDFYELAAENGHIEILKHLEAIEGFNQLEAARAVDYQAYRYAAANGHLEILKHLEAIEGFNALDAARAVDYQAYRYAAENGHIEVLEHLEAIESFDILDAAYVAYPCAAKNGHIATLEHLEAIEGFNASDAARFIFYLPYRNAAHDSHIATLKHLEAIEGFDKQKAAGANDYEPFRRAVADGDVLVFEHLIKINSVFAYAEKHDFEYGEEYIYGHVSSFIHGLKQQQSAYEGEHPNGVFDVEEDTAIHAFYALRNLIRRGVDRVYGSHIRAAEDLSNDIRFLLSIPGVKDLCHQRMTADEYGGGRENELLRLANRMGNESAAQILLQLTRVRELAEDANFYSDDAFGAGLDLRALSQDRESSMVALSESERRLVHQTELHYQSSIRDKGGIAAVFLLLKEELERRYNESPATIICKDISGEEFEEQLPFAWDDWDDLASVLTEEQKKQALEAYYRHDAHTAYRYLSRPNKWMHPHASYVYISDDGQERWSTFEEYQSLIALFFTAAFDDSAPAIDGYTLETRKELFIRQLALIGRAHNWDKANEQGQEYDDGEADKPSCFSGVNRRLFQSVLGHGLFKVVTKQIVIQALNEQIKAHFDEVITLENALELKEAYAGMIELEGDMDANLACLKRLDISAEKKEVMIEKACAQLSDAYKANFDEHKVGFISAMRKELDEIPSEAHFIQFQAACSLDKLLEQKAKSAKQAQWVVEQWRHCLWKAKHEAPSPVDEKPASAPKGPKLA